MGEDMEAQTIFFDKSDWVPNNQTLPVIVYREIFICDDGCEEFARLFTSHGWEGVWRDGVFDYQHYHAGAHEVLGIGKGTVKLLIGGPTGKVLELHAGDCLVLPAGTGHQNLGASSDFRVVGAYPPGQHADVQTSAATAEFLKTIAEVALPETDPVQGASGPLFEAWHLGNR